MCPMRTGSAILFLSVLLTLFSTEMFARTPPASTATANHAASVPLPASYAALLEHSSQAILVTTPDWNSVDGSLQRYEKRNGQWLPVGDKLPIVVGEHGIGWDGTLSAYAPASAPVKKEGDGRSPAGIFPLGQTFGFASTASELKMPYLSLTDSIECVDDTHSQSYNQVVDRQQLAHPDWNSSEKMRTIAVYKVGLVVNYNHQHTPGAGSCIFMHIWHGPGRGTAGCTAMDESKLQELLSWLDASQYPVLIQLPQAMYEELKTTWKLP